jgi:hypothetical protein
VLIAVDDLLAPPGRDPDWDDLLAERAGPMGRHGTLMRTQGQRVLSLAGDPVLASQVLSCLDHAARHRVVAASGRHPAAGEAIDQLGVACPGPPADRVRVVLDLAHALGPACDDEVTGAGLDAHGGVGDGLKARSTSPVEL